MRFVAFLLCACTLSAAERASGYRGIWYMNQPTKDKYVYKYSGGFATYPQQHAPIAIYSKAANKTFFCYGGTVPGKQELLHMVSYYDHATGTVPRPTVLLNKHTDDAHDNPVLSIDSDGYLWIFSPAHGTTRPSYLHRSTKPYSIDEFEKVWETNWSYPQPWYVPGQGFLFLHTRYRKVQGGGGSGRALHWMTSPDGRTWSEPQLLAFALQGHYQVSWPKDGRVATAFDIHPLPLGLNQRTNLYYLETRDLGKTWTTAAGTPVPVPLESEQNPALVRDFHKEGLLVYLKDVQWDSAGRPVILYVVAKRFEPGPENGPRHFEFARWTGKTWTFTRIAETDHNYDHGSLYIEAEGVWRMIAPTAPGPQPYSTGGDIDSWISRDDGKTWKRDRALTSGGPFNHTYVRRPLNAHPDFYAIWADGDALKPSESRIYFATRNGDVYMLPETMESDSARPALQFSGRRKTK